jgi:hypothetical protein
MVLKKISESENLQFGFVKNQNQRTACHGSFKTLKNWWFSWKDWQWTACLMNHYALITAGGLFLFLKTTQH